VIAVQTRRAEVGVVATIGGTLDHDHQVDALTESLACLLADGLLIVDLSEVFLPSSSVVERLARAFRVSFGTANVRVVAAKLTARVLLARAGLARPVYASVADALQVDATNADLAFRAAGCPSPPRRACLAGASLGAPSANRSRLGRPAPTPPATAETSGGVCTLVGVQAPPWLSPRSNGLSETEPLPTSPRPDQDFWPVIEPGPEVTHGPIRSASPASVLA